jgi:hypothetical protein
MLIQSILLDIFDVSSCGDVRVVLMISLCCLHLCGLRDHRLLLSSIAGIDGFRRVSGVKSQ